MTDAIIFPIIAVVFTLISLISMIYLMIHARDLARVFRGKRSDIVTGPGVRQVSRKAIWTALILFNIGWIAAIATWSWGYNATDPDAELSVTE